MIYGKYFLVAFLLSALGTIPIGLITLTIAQKTIEKGKVSGIMIALGAVIPEFLYTFIALKGMEFFERESAFEQYIKVISLFLFLGLALYYFFKKQGHSKIKKAENNRDFLHGIFTGMMNFLIIPYWLFIGVWLKSNGFIFVDNLYIFNFSSGAALGAFAIFYVYIILASSVLKKSERINYYANKVIGVLFFGLTIFQLYQIL